MSQDSTAVPRRFTKVQLGRLLSAASKVDCECPNQLAKIVASLVAFEDYSASCESKNAEDAAVHARNVEGTARARVIMEELLAELAAFEGIDY